MNARDEMTPHAAEIRLAQYGEHGKPYESGNEKALYEIALTLKGEIDRLRANVAGLKAAAGQSRAEVIAERDAQIIAWLGKKAGEYGVSNRENRAKAEAVGRMADKLSRGAVR